MGKVKLLLDVISDLRSLADSLQAVADSIADGSAAETITSQEQAAEKSRAGHTAEVKALLTKHGADKLSDIDPAEYPALLADAEVL